MSKIDVSILKKNAPKVLNPENVYWMMRHTLEARDKFIEDLSEDRKEKLRKKGINV